MNIYDFNNNVDLYLYKWAANCYLGRFRYKIDDLLSESFLISASLFPYIAEVFPGCLSSK